MSDCGRKQTLVSLEFDWHGRPLWVRADIRPGTLEIGTSHRPLYPRNRTLG